jgi:hypothetical protein
MGCNTANGESCDANNNNGFQCFTMPPNTEKLCGMCDSNNGPECLPGSTCTVGGTCAKYCCNDGDCGSGTCNKNMTTNDPNVGICIVKTAADAGPDAPGPVDAGGG